MKTILLNISLDDVLAESLLESWQSELKSYGANITSLEHDNTIFIIGKIEVNEPTASLEILDLDDTDPTSNSNELDVENIEEIPSTIPLAKDSSEEEQEESEKNDVEEISSTCIIRKLSSDPLNCVISKSRESQLTVSNLETSDNEIKFNLFNTQYTLPGSPNNTISLFVEMTDEETEMKMNIEFKLVDGDPNEIVIGTDSKKDSKNDISQE